MQQLWPDPRPLTQDDLIALYETERDRPWLRVNFVSSLDGAGTLGGKSAGLSGEEDKRVFGILRMLCDALVVGAGTVREEGYRAVRLDAERRAWRTRSGISEFPTLVIVSGRADLDPAHPALRDAPVRPIVVTRHGTDTGHLTDVADIVKTDDDLREAVGHLHERGLTQLLSEGGPQLFGALQEADLVDELCLTLSPLLAGPGAGRIAAGTPAENAKTLTLRHVLMADGQLMLRHSR